MAQGQSDIVDVPATAGKTQGAEPFLARAFTLLIDHEEIEIQKEAAKDVLNEVREITGKDRVAFDASTKEAGCCGILICWTISRCSAVTVTSRTSCLVRSCSLTRLGRIERPANLFDRYPELNRVRHK